MRNLYKREKGEGSSHKLFLKVIISAILLIFSSFASFGQNVVFQCDFEDDAENANWTLVNDDQTNQWYIGSAANNGGSNGLYITNDGGASNEYTFDDVELTVYAYRTIEITENTICNISFDWISEGEFYYDYALAFIIPNGSDFSDFDNIWIDDYDSNSLYDVPSGWIYISNSIMNGVTSWQNSTRRIVLAQGTYNLVFFWKNNESDGENPPVAIDNISIIKEAPATLPYTCNFENATENEKWILANCDYYNGWYIGSGAYNGGSKGLYISNDQGTSNSADYDDTYVYAYREINTSETGEYVIDFDWRAYGENPYESSDAYTLLRSFIIPTSINPNLNECNDNGMSSYNNNTPSGWIDASSSENGLMYGQSSWQHSSKVLSIDAGTYYLVFFWKNNSDHIDPPAAVDNISISRVVNPAVATSSVSNLGATSATLNGEILNQGASDITERGFMYGTSSGNLSNTLPSTDNTDAFSYELTGLAENTTYYYRAYATNNNGTGYGAVKSFKTLNTLNGHIFVDLGLPSGLLWATTNVGASSPEDSGDYFAWGEIEPKEMYSLENYKYSYSDSQDELLTKYCDNPQYGHDGFVDNLSILEASDDAATANWGSEWHMPSVSEFEELMDNCTLTWTTQNGASGYLFTGSNGSSIFMPAAGYRNDGDLLTGYGEYWARTNVATMPNYANYLGFYEDNPFTDYESRHFGYSVRPVLTASPTVETNSATDVESTSATLQGKILFAEDATVTNRGFMFGTDSENLTQNFTSPDNTDYFSYTVTGLTENTTYYFKAYATINGETKYGEVKLFKPSNPNIVFQYDFEDDTENANWTLANGNQTNKWYIGSAASNGGSNGLYISNDGGASNAYSNGSTSYVYAYREINIEENAVYNVEFDWRANGEDNYDNLKAFIVPASLNSALSAGAINGMSGSNNSTPNGWINCGNNETLSGNSDWQHSNTEVTLEAGTYSLVFFWKNDNSAGSNPSAAVDNISIVKNSCPTVSNIIISNIDLESATISWTERGSATSWEIIVSEEELDDGELEVAVPTATVSSPSYSATGLSSATAYYVYVRAICSSYDNSDWERESFTTLLCSAQNMCEISYSLTDSDGDGWTGNEINVIDVQTESVLATWTIEDGREATGTLGVCDGREIRFEYVEGNYSQETSYQILDVNGDEIFSGSDIFSSPILYTVSCSSCRMVNNIQVTNVSNESATINWTERGSAESWEIVVSEEELESDVLEDNTTTVSAQSYTATGLTPITEYYVYVRPVCSDDNKGGWKTTTFITSACPPEDMCTLRYTLSDSYGDGWNGNAINVIDEETELILATWTMETGSTMSGTLGVCDGREIRFEWVEGNSAYETSYRVYYSNGTEVLSGSGSMDSPFSYIVECPPPVEATTQRATSTSATATLAGEVVFDRIATVTQVGFEYGESEDQLTHTETMAYSENTFTKQITGLTPQTIYYYRAFAVYNDDITTYGDVVSFRTKQNDTDGTEDNPLTIESAEEWAQFGEAMYLSENQATATYKGFEVYNSGEDTYFELTTDIDISVYDAYINFFSGYLKGNGNTIQSKNQIFTTINNGSVDNLNIIITESIELREHEVYIPFGIVSSIANSATISNCTVSGATEDVLINASYLGDLSAIVAQSNNSTITNCVNNLPITNDRIYAVGIVATINGGSVTGCINNAALTGIYASGIVGSITGGTLSSNLNTGKIIGEEGASGILYEAKSGNVVVDGCMNIGEVYSTEKNRELTTTGGIVATNDVASLSISNCANYGSFSNLSAHIGGIFGNGVAQLSSNISAPIFIENSVEGNPYNSVYATIGTDAEHFSNDITEEDDFFDEQISDLRVDSLRLRYASRGTGMPTSEVVGTALQSSLSTNWTYTDGLLPMPAGIPEDNRTTVARIPIYLAENDKSGAVRNNFTLPTSILGHDVTWESSNPDVISITDGNAMVTRPAEGEASEEVTITATYEGETRSFVLRIIPPKSVPVSTDDPDVDDIVYLYGYIDPDDENLSYLTEYGFIYGTQSDISDATRVVSTNLDEWGSFNYELEDLEEGRTYYVAAFASTADTTTYGEIMEFRIPGPPEITIGCPLNRTTTSMEVKVLDAVSDEEEEEPDVIMYYGTDRNNLTEYVWVTYDDDYHYYSAFFNNLQPATEYWFVAEISDSYGTSRSDTVAYYTYGTFTDDRDNNEYYTIQIGDQTWMAENLKYVGNLETSGDGSYTEPYLYYPDWDEENVSTYGYQYNWVAAMNGEESSDKNPSGVQGICPEGWHLPSYAEWTQLTNAIAETDAGSRLASNDELWDNIDVFNLNYFGESGFAALPAGSWVGSEFDNNFGIVASFWTATGSDETTSFIFHVAYNTTYFGETDNEDGRSIRCVKGTTIYAYDTVNYCGEQYTFGTQTLTATGDYEEAFSLGTDKDSIVYLHLTMYPELTATISSFSNGCFGASNGFVEVSADGGAGTYTYRWDTPSEQTNARLSNLTDGEYTVTVTDSVGCTATISQMIITPGQLTVSLSGDNQICEGSEANITANAEGGTPDYAYTWSNGTTAQTTTVQTDGTYIVTVTDDADCTATASISVTVLLAPTLELTSGPLDQNVCYGNTLITAEFTYGGGANGANVTGLPNGVSFTNNTTANTIQITGSPTTAGSYDYTVTTTGATSPCTNISITGTITVYPQLTAEVTGNNPNCYGDATTLTATANGGTPNYTYNWSNSESTLSITDTPLANTEYSVTVTDANGCAATSSMEVIVPAELTASLSADEIQCNGGTTDITSTVEGGRAPYSYLWSNNTTTSNLTGAVAGTYRITVTDANSCTASASVTIDEPAALAVSISAGTITCYGESIDITASATGGSAGYSYRWSDDLGTTPSINVEAGDYVVTVTDANGCTATASTNISQPNELTATITPIGSILCPGGTLSNLSPSISGGTQPYTYLWNNGETTNRLSNPGAGTYSLTVTDANDCTTSATITVNDPTPVSVSLSADDILCHGGTTNITNTITGGSEQYISYAWSNGASVQNLSNVSAGTYSVTVRDHYGCEGTSSITISEPDELTVEISGSLSVCENTPTTLTANATGGTQDYTYSWNTGETSSELTTPNITETTSYSVTVTDANSCVATTSVTVEIGDTPGIEIVAESSACFGDEIVLQANISNAGSNYTLTWSASPAETAGLTNTESIRITVTPSAIDSYTYAASLETTSCTDGQPFNTSAQATIIVNQLPTISITNNTGATEITCSTTEIPVTATGGSSYEWSNGETTAELIVSNAGTYMVTATDANGCTGTASISITEDVVAPNISASTSNDVICLTENTTLTASGAESYLWSPEAGLSATIGDEVVATPTETTTYTVTATANNGCTASANVVVTVNQPATAAIEQTACSSFDWNGNTYIESGIYEWTTTAANGCDSVVTLHLTINQPTESNDTAIACISYEWNGITYTESGEYQQTLQTVNGCDSVVTLHLIINNNTTGEFADQMCSGVPYEYNGQTYTEAGTYYVQLVNANGCDSIVTLTLTYADNCNGIVSGVVTDAATGEAIQNARVMVGNVIARTNNDGEYSLSVLRGSWLMRVSATDYATYSETIDVQDDMELNVELYTPRIAMSIDSILVTTYPYLAHNDSITITNTGNTTLVWSSLTDYENLELLPEQEEIHRNRNSRALWDSIQTFTTHFNAEQAIATDGFFIYTSSWQRPGEFNRYTPDGEYIETFFIENVGMIRNLSFDGTYFYATEASNTIFKLDLDNQTLVDSIVTDINSIRHCSFDRQNGNLLVGDWNSLYSIDTATGVATQIRDDLMNVYSSTYDNLSQGGPYLWLFTQTSQDNGPSAYIRQFSISTGDFTDNTHYLDDLGLGDASLAGGICASEYIVNGKFVLLANVQNPSGNNTIATYEIGRTNNFVSTNERSGELQPNESMTVVLSEYVTETGDYNATVKYRIAVMGSQPNDVPIAISSVAPECNAVQQITMVTDTFSTVTLNWQPVELGEYNSVSYLIFGDNSDFAIDTTSETTITFDGLSVGEHCYNVRAMLVSNYTCVSEPSDTVCTEIQEYPCNMYITVESESDGESIFVEWNKPAGVEYFRISRDDGAVDEILYDNSYIDSDVVSETDYCYTITGYLNNSFCSEISSTTCMRIVSEVCAEAPELKVETIGNSVVLSWTNTGDSQSYQIFRNDEPIGTTTDTTYYDKAGDSGNYCYKVKSVCEQSMFAFSNEECVDVDGIAEWTDDNLSIYPNPTYGQFFIKGSRIAKVRIYNAAGQLVAEFDNNESERIEINCNEWNPGLYNIRIVSAEGRVATRKVSIFR
ncbi:MAG: fibronectin type III domain-containing protein [Bacteroidales bacterium]|nr:fibronectin type III domain-containing protein [Bacteroidales bacterium]